MEKQDLSDPPPPYYVDIGPPLKPCNGEVYPYYISQYQTPVAAPQTTRATLSTPPSREKRRCCRSRPQCYGGAGAVLLLLALLALAIWLGFRFGSRLVAVPINNGYKGDDGHDGHVDEDPPLRNNDHCSNRFLCDGKENCPLDTDESDCVSFSSEGLQVRTSQDGRFLPVCSKGWTQENSDKTCTQLGFKGSYLTKTKEIGESIGLTVTQGSSPFIQGILNVSTSCPDSKTVSLQCVDCGRRQSTSRILNGSVAEKGSQPWQMSIHKDGKHTCGGILIAHDIVMSAAHCLYSVNNAKDLLVYGGSALRSELTKPHLVQKIKVNEKYNDKTHDNDIALVKLDPPFSFTDYILPACLPTSGKEFQPGTVCKTSGFGHMSEQSYSLSNNLMVVDVPIISNDECNSADMYRGSITENMICAGYKDGGKDSCQGDSGGPLVCSDENQLWSVVGITSWGEGCGREFRPGVYTKVSRFLPWIYRTMQKMSQ